MRGLWPAANFQDFPITRVGALTFLIACVVALVLVSLLLQRLWRRTGTTSDHCAILGQSEHRGWGWWSCGQDVVAKDGQSLVIEQHRCCCSCSRQPRVLIITKTKVKSLAVVRRPVTCKQWILSLVQTSLVSILFGMWLHFVPCIWWTCDLGPDDGGQIRGGLWIVGGIICFITLTVRLRRVSILIRYSHLELGTEDSAVVSVGGDDVYRQNDPGINSTALHICEFLELKPCGSKYGALRMVSYQSQS